MHHHVHEHQDTLPVKNDADSTPGPEDEGQRNSTETLDLAPAAPIMRRHSSSAGVVGGAADGQEGARDNGAVASGTSANDKQTLRKVTSSHHSLKRVDSPAVLRAEADKAFQVRWRAYDDLSKHLRN